MQSRHFRKQHSRPKVDSFSRKILCISLTLFIVFHQIIEKFININEYRRRKLKKRKSVLWRKSPVLGKFSPFQEKLGFWSLKSTSLSNRVPHIIISVSLVYLMQYYSNEMKVFIGGFKDSETQSRVAFWWKLFQSLTAFKRLLLKYYFQRNFHLYLLFFFFNLLLFIKYLY